MFLAVDIGNTNIDFGIYQDDKLLRQFKINTCKLQESEQNIVKNLSDYKITNCIISSVVKDCDKNLKLITDRTFNINSLIVNSEFNFGLKININNPTGLGIDRILGTYSALKKYSAPLIIIDFGTAITFDVVNADSEYIGGLIMPGINTQLKSLAQNTSKLPKIEIDECEKVIGTDTKTAILSGTLRATSCAVEGLIKETKKELNSNATVIATGGDCEIINKYISTKFDHVEPSLVLDGLNFVNNCNMFK